MDLISEFFARVFHPRELLQWGGYPVMMAVIFAETGLLVGFFLPGDSLLVTAGFLVQGGYMDPLELGTFSNLILMNVALITMAIVGDAVGFWIGFRAGPKIFTREQSFFFRKDHLIATQKFYEKHGGKTIVLARFMPFARTFAPVIAGVGRMSYRRFAFYNVFGGIGWVVSMTFTGYFLGKIFDAKQIERVVILVIILSLLPLVIGYIKQRRSASKAAAEPADPAAPAAAAEQPAEKA